jgi:hypothetical protein
MSTDLIARIERLMAVKVQSHAAVHGGYTPAIRLLCQTADSTFFVKAGASPLTGRFLRREIDVYTRLSAPFMPPLLASEDHEAQPILILEDLSAHHWPPPWNTRQVDLVLAQIETMHNTKLDIEPYAQVFDRDVSSWQTIAADPQPFLSLGVANEQWLNAALPLLIHYEAQCSTEGDSLTHGDLRSDNICLAPGRTLFVDWNLASLSNPRLDLGFWLPSLAYEGGPPPEQILPDAPEIAAWVAGFFAARAGLPTIPDAPRVRLVQQQQLATALPWAIRALHLPPLA